MNASPRTRFWVRSRIFLRSLGLPLVVGAAAAASAAFLASGGRWGLAAIAGALGLLSGAVASTLQLIAPEHRLAARWPRLSLAGWCPPASELASLPLELYDAGEAALGHCGAARQVLGVRADTFRQQVAGLVGKGDLAYARALEARAWLAEASRHPKPGSTAAAPEKGGLGRWVKASARAREAREAEVERDLRAAQEELASTTQMLGDLALRMAGLEGALGPGQAERRQILPHLAQLHEEMSALERAVTATPVAGLEVIS